MTIKIFLDSANLPEMVNAYNNKRVQGFTTNPTLMRNSGVIDYTTYAKKVIETIPDLPISFEVISDYFSIIKQEALTISGWGENVYVKIPVTTSNNESSYPLIYELSHAGVKLNVTAVYHAEQVESIKQRLNKQVPCIISIFAGRLADKGVDPVPVMSRSSEILSDMPDTELLWASCREPFNIIQAEQCGCDIITVPLNILNKVHKMDRDIMDLSAITARTFSEDAKHAGYIL